jgi:hypothetical protein
MKTITKILTITAIIVAFVGCGGATAKPPSERTPLTIQERQVSNIFVLEGRIAYENTTPIQAAALLLREAAKKMKAQGYEYFVLNGPHVNPMTTTFSALVAYDYPDNAGPHFKDYGTKSTGLETDKKVREVNYKEGGAKGFRIIAGARKEPLLETPTWSVEQVLNDPLIEKYIQAGFEDAEILPKNQVVSFNTNKKLRTWYKH